MRSSVAMACETSSSGRCLHVRASCHRFGGVCGSAWWVARHVQRCRHARSATSSLSRHRARRCRDARWRCLSDARSSSARTRRTIACPARLADALTQVWPRLASPGAARGRSTASSSMFQAAGGSGGPSRLGRSAPLDQGSEPAGTDVRPEGAGQEGRPGLPRQSPCPSRTGHRRAWAASEPLCQKLADSLPLVAGSRIVYNLTTPYGRGCGGRSAVQPL